MKPDRQDEETLDPEDFEPGAGALLPRLVPARVAAAARTAAHAASQKVRKRIEEIFGWAKTTGCFRKSRYRGVERTHAQGQYVVAAWNLVRMAKLFGSPPSPARA